MRTLAIWPAKGGDYGDSVVVEGLVRISEAGLSEPGSGPVNDALPAMLLTPAPKAGRSGAIALVPDAMSADVFLNGAPLAGGAHLVQHADRLRVRETDYWLGMNVSPERTRYDPARHGEGMFCFLTKARLKSGEAILICEGTPTTPCRVLYRLSAWLPDSPCANCGYDPSALPWRPPVSPRRKTLDALLRLAERR